MNIFEDNLFNLYFKLECAYNDKYPIHNDHQSGADYILSYRRYFGRIKMIEILEQAEGRAIEFVCLHPDKDEELWSSDDFTYRYLGEIVAPEAPTLIHRNLIREYYTQANLYTTKYEGPDENPLWYRDLLGIEKTTELLKKALHQNKAIDADWDNEKETIVYSLVSWEEEE